MLKLRPYKPSDGETVVSWIGDETAFRMWSADRYESYPISGNDMNRYYGGFADADWFYPMTAFDGDRIVGHMILRFTDPEKTRLRFGFIIVDASLRGKGYGKQMLRLALKYAFEILFVREVTLGVMEGNLPAERCYGGLGFRFTGQTETCTASGREWTFREMCLPREDYLRFAPGPALEL